MTIDTSKSSLTEGAYTLPDAARLLNLPLARLRTWVSGSLAVEPNSRGRRYPVGQLASKGAGHGRTFCFLTLIELFSIAQLRARGLAMVTLREARAELAHRYQTPHPFALEGLLTDGRHLLKELGDASLLELGTGGQTSFQSVLAPFVGSMFNIGDFSPAGYVAEFPTLHAVWDMNRSGLAAGVCHARRPRRVEPRFRDPPH